MRLFVALPIALPVRRELVRRVTIGRVSWPRARWEREEKIHLTLLFLGEVAGGRVEELIAALRRTCVPHSPQQLRLTAPGAFPSRGGARVLWVGLDGGDSLTVLQRELAAAGQPFVERPETRTFHPHLTLARCAPPWGSSELASFLAAFADLEGRSTADAALLLASELGAGGSRYQELARLPFEGERP